MIWKALLLIGHHLFGLVFLLALVVFFTGAGNRRFAKNLGNEQIVFAPSGIQFGAWAVTIIYLVHEAADAFQHHYGKSSNFVDATSLAFMAIFFLCLFPGTIVVADDGLRQVYWFSKSKHIRWEEIVEIKTGIKDRTVTITGANRTKIIHSNQLPDRTRLLVELKQHCGENLPPDFPRESDSSQN